ncbi:MAG: aminotransferase class IV [Deltaproteobacteria bacterium]|nr:aminotransferase class IV [Deltaproteobacteria bacterium]
MLSDRIVYFNGDYVALDQATVHLMSHSFSRGSAIFEVLGLHETNDGPAIFRLNEHIQRFFKSACLLGMEIPLGEDDLYIAVIETVKRNTCKKGLIKIMGYYPQIALGVLPPAKAVEISIFVVDPIQDLGDVVFPLAKNVSVCISKWRKLDPGTVPIEAKVAANYLNGMIAQAEAKSRGFDNSIMLDTKGLIAEGPTESVFLVKDGQLMTPSLNSVLQSITRKSLLQLASVVGVEAIEQPLLPDLLFEAQEIFLSGTPTKVLPVRQIENRVLEKTPGTVTHKLSRLVKSIVSGSEERFKEWLFYIK